MALFTDPDPVVCCDLTDAASRLAFSSYLESESCREGVEA